MTTGKTTDTGIRSWFKGKKDELKAKLSGRNAKKFKKYLNDGTQAVQGTASVSDADVKQFILKSGLDYKGQINYAFQQVGGSFSGGVSVDVFKLAGLSVGLPFLPVTLTISPSGSLEAARHRLIVASYLNNNPKPVVLENMRGYTGKVGLSLGVETGLSFSPTKDVPGLEEAGFSFEVSATASANASYTGSYLRVWDPAPTYYSRSEIGGGLTSALQNALTTTPKSSPYNPLCSFSSWVQNGEGDAGLQAKAAASFEVKGVGKAGAEASATGPKIEGKYNYGTYRLQTVGSDGIVMTQDAQLTFKKVSAQLIELTASASAEQAVEALENVPEGLIPPLEKEKEDLFGLKDKTTKLFVNALSYRAAVLYWNATTKKVESAGLQLGHSVTIENLVAIVDGKFTEARRDKFVTTLAAAINVPPDNLKAFLKEAADLIGSLAMDEGKQPDALFIEADFQASGTGTLFKPDAKEPTSLVKAFGVGGGLETIRLRYRMKDTQENSTSLIKLGFTWTVGANFELNKFENYGTGGWFDVYKKSLKTETVPAAMIIA